MQPPPPNMEPSEGRGNLISSLSRGDLQHLYFIFCLLAEPDRAVVLGYNLPFLFSLSPPPPLSSPSFSLQRCVVGIYPRCLWENVSFARWGCVYIRGVGLGRGENQQSGWKGGSRGDTPPPFAGCVLLSPINLYWAHTAWGCSHSSFSSPFSLFLGSVPSSWCSRFFLLHLPPPYCQSPSDHPPTPTLKSVFWFSFFLSVSTFFFAYK